MTDPAMPAEDATRIRSVGLAYRGAFLYVPAWWLISVPAGRRLLSYGVYLMLPIMAFLAYRLARALRFGGLGSALLAIASAAGLLGIVPFAYLSIRATKELRRAGIRVGLLGPRVKDLPALSQEVGKAAK